MVSAYMSSCIRPDVRLTPDQRILCSGCCEKYSMACSLLRQSSLISYCIEARHFSAYDQSYTFAQYAVQTARWRLKLEEFI